MSGGDASLKCVIAWSDRRNLCSLVEDELQARLGSDELLRLGDDALVVCAGNEPADIRDWIRAALDDDETVLVFEFERWSGYGPGIDPAWLLRRGH
jgi:hypothetical protein